MDYLPGDFSTIHYNLARKVTDLSDFTNKPDSQDTYADIARGARDACLTIFRMELDEVYQKARKESRLDAMVDLNEVRARVEKRIEALNAEAER